MVEAGSSASAPIRPPATKIPETAIGMTSGSARRAHSSPAASQHAPSSHSGP